jgi:hypothetical protein
MNETSKSLINREPMPFGGTFDQLYNRMMRAWPVQWPDFASADDVKSA